MKNNGKNIKKGNVRKKKKNRKNNLSHTSSVSGPYQLHTKSKCIDTEQIRS